MSFDDFDSDFDPEKVLVRARECAYDDNDEECPIDESTLLLQEITTIAAMTTTTDSNSRSSSTSRSITDKKDQLLVNDIIHHLKEKVR